MAQEEENLLKSVSEISKKYEKKYRKNQEAGVYYNIFNIIGKASDEVNIHTKFLANLLNPKGDHGCGDIFLKTFLEQVKVNIGKKDLTKSKVYYEYDIGPITEDYINGGRLDILIEISKNFAIIIENKIYAGDQEKQLLRYYNYAKKYKKNKIFYLTLHGNEPSDKSTDGNDKYWEEISYEEHIKNFLESWLNCNGNKNKTHIYPIIQQYTQLIDYLTDNYVSEGEEGDIKKLLLKENNIKLAFELQKQILPAKEEIFKKLFNTLKEKVKEINNQIILNIELNEPNTGAEQTRYWRIYIHRNSWNSKLTFELDSITFESKFGITLKDDKNTKTLQKKLRALKPNKNNHFWWIIWDHPSEDYAYWNAEIFEHIYKKPISLAEILTDKIKSYIPVLDDITENIINDGKFQSDLDQIIDEKNILLKDKNLLYAEKLCNELDEALVSYFIGKSGIVKECYHCKYFDNDNKYLYFLPIKSQNGIFEIGFGNYLENGFSEKDIDNYRKLFENFTFSDTDLEYNYRFKNSSWVGRKYKYNGDFSSDSLKNLKNKIKNSLKTLIKKT